MATSAKVLMETERPLQSQSCCPHLPFDLAGGAARSTLHKSVVGVRRLEGCSQSIKEKAKRKPLDAEERNLIIQGQGLSNAVACGNTKNFNKVPNELYDPERRFPGRLEKAPMASLCCLQ